MFRQTISGTSNLLYTDFSFAYGKTNGKANFDFDGAGRWWHYYYPNNAELTMVMSVRADNPVGIDFSGRAEGRVSIVSNAPVIIADPITNPNGNTTVRATAGDVSVLPAGGIYHLDIGAAGAISSNGSNAGGAINTHDLVIGAAGGIGSNARPIPVTITGAGATTGAWRRRGRGRGGSLPQPRFGRSDRSHQGRRMPAATATSRSRRRVH